MAARLDFNDDLVETHEINVTPFIDVILVLLIIFMVAAPLATVDVAVDLPSASAEPQPRPKDPIYLTLQSDLTLSLGDQPVVTDALSSALAQASGNDPKQRVYLRADRQVDYGELMDLMNRLRGLGYTQIALVGQELVP